MMIRTITATSIYLSVAGLAVADPCEGELPTRAGHVFTGTVRYVVDGDGICVGKSRNPNEWIEVRFADFDAPELRTKAGRKAKSTLARLTKGKQIRCIVTPGRRGRTTTYDRVLARCSANGHSIAHMMRRAGIKEGGN